MHMPRLLDVLLFVHLVAAWSGLDALEDVKAVHGVEDLLWRRADSASSAASSATATAKSASDSASASASDSSASGTDASSAAAATGGSAKTDSTAKATGTDKTSGTASKATGSKTTGKSSKTTDFDARLPAGGISMITPNSRTSQYYKIGDWVTFAWNYTSLSVTPSAIDVLASCSANQATYTLAVNQSADSTEILWDTGAYQSTATVPLLTETYTLIIYDAESSISATSKAGYLAVSEDFTFGMYSPQPYTPLSEYNCATCSGALSSTERQTLAFLGGMTAITVLSFTWFASGICGVF